MTNRIASLIHRFANSKQINENCGNVSTEHRFLYSYAEVIGCHFDEGIAVNVKNFSITTSKHQHYLQSAIPYRASTYFCKFNNDIKYQSFDEFIEKQYIPYYIKELENLKTDLVKNPRKIKSIVNSATSTIEDLNRCNTETIVNKICVHFNIKSLDDLIQSFSDKKTLDKLKEQAKIEELKKQEKQKQIVLEWKNFIDNAVYPQSNDVTYLRFNKKLNLVETSKHIHLSLDEALAFYAAFKNNKLSAGDKIKEHFRVTKIKKDRIIIGCHTILNSEIEETYNLIKG